MHARGPSPYLHSRPHVVKDAQGAAEDLRAPQDGKDLAHSLPTEERRHSQQNNNKRKDYVQNQRTTARTRKTPARSRGGDETRIGRSDEDKSKRMQRT